MSIQQELCKAIDAQNVEALSQLITDNPTLDLNVITPNRLSALWWALSPPGNREISIDIVNILMNTMRFDPSQRYANIRISHQLFSNQAINEIIRHYDGQYIRQPEPTKVLDDTLVNFVGNTQNTHDSRVVKAVDAAITALYRRYVKDNDSLAWDSGLVDFLNSEKLSETLKQADYMAANNAITRIKDDLTTREYIVSLENSVITLNLVQVLMLVWHALNDRDETSFVIGIEMSESEICVRKNRLIAHLIFSQNEYGENSEACWMGTRNQIISCLDATHMDVRIAQNLALTKEMIEQKHAAHCKERLRVLAEKNPVLFWDYLFYYAFRGMLGGCGSEELVPEVIKEWVEITQRDFCTSIRGENRIIDIDFQMPTDELDKLVALLMNPNDEPYPTLNHSLLYPLQRIETLLYLAQNHYPKLLDLKKTTMTLVEVMQTLRDNRCDLLAIVAAINNHLMQQVDDKALLVWLYKNETYRQFLITLDDSVQIQWIRAHWPRLIEYLSAPGCHPSFFPQSDWLWQQIEETLLKTIPTLAEWFSGLPNSVKALFLQKLIENQWHEAYENYQDQIKKEVILFALREGYMMNVPLNDAIVLKSQDLRGIDLSVINLNRIVFDHCDLLLTNIKNNPSITSDYLSGNRIDSFWLFDLLKKTNKHLMLTQLKIIMDTEHYTEQILSMTDNNQCTVLHWAGHLGYAEALAYLLNSASCTKEILQMQDHRGLTALHWAMYSGHADTVRVILNSKHCTEHLLKMVDSSGYIALHYGVYSNHKEAVMMMLASVHCSDNVLRMQETMDKYTPRELAKFRNFSEIMTLFDKRTPQEISLSENQASFFSSSSNETHKGGDKSPGFNKNSE